MATITKRDLVSKALAKLEIVGTGQTAAAEDYFHALDCLNGVIAQLSAEFALVVPVTDGASDDLDEIDTRYMHPLRDLVAFELSPDFSKSQDLRTRAIYVGQIQSMLEVGHDFEPVAFNDY